MLSTLAVAGYRSLRQLVLPLSQLNIITGANGSGKSNVYRSLRLLAEIAQGGAIASIAREGGFGSVLWAGPEEISAAVRRGDYPVEPIKRKEPYSLKLGLASAQEHGFSYAIDLGKSYDKATAFVDDPSIKYEMIWSGPVLRPSTVLVERRNAQLRIKGDQGLYTIDKLIPSWASAMTEFADPLQAPEMITMREQMRSWRFYDHFRCDAQAPARQPQLGSRTLAMMSDGSDFAPAMQTIFEVGDGPALEQTVSDAFPGSSVVIVSSDGRFEVCMQQHGMLRPLRSAELSDGTLRYLLWAVALLTPRPPELMVLNEPETSLHPDLLPALGRLIAKAAQYSQLIVVSHSPRLIAAMEQAARDLTLQSIMLEKSFGETYAANLPKDQIPSWTWPKR